MTFKQWYAAHREEHIAKVREWQKANSERERLRKHERYIECRDLKRLILRLPE